MADVSATSSTSTTTATRTSYSQNRNEFDTDALVEEAVAAKLARADSLEIKVADNEATISAYEEMQDLLLTMQDSLQTLRSEPGTSGSSSDVFKNRTAYLTSSTSTEADTILSATVEDGTEIGTHEVTVSQIAKAERLGGGSVASRSSDLGWSGSFVLGTYANDDTSTLTSATITVTSTMSLDDIRDAINAETSSTGVTASVIKVAEDDYMLVLTAENTDQDIAISGQTGDDVLQSVGITAADGSFANVLQEAQGAILTVDGVSIQRASNDIDDALDGITLHLYKADPGNALSLEVDNNLSDIKEQIQALVDAYNEFRTFVLTNQATADSGEASEDAVLFGDSVLRSVTKNLQETLSSGVDGVSMADIGLSFDENNKLVLDEDELDNALMDDLDAIETLFSYKVETSSGNLKLLRHGDGPKSASFTLDITVSGSSVTSVSVGGDAALFTVSGNTISGAAGTEYEGLTFVFTGTASQSISVSTTQGIADQMWSTVEEAADEADGMLTATIADLEGANDDLEERISTIESNAESYRSYLLDKYSRIEAKLAEAQSTLDLLESLTNSNSD